jgi:phage terminase large subunit-like protein
VTTLVVPSLDEKPWPTLGPQVCDFLEAFGCYGPGDLAGEPYVVTDDFRGQIYRAYEVYPKGDKLAGRRRFKRCYLEQRKGTAKTERAMLLTMAEIHPAGPVRCDGFDADGRPVGRGVRHPYVPLVSYNVEQTEDLAMAVLRFILSESPLVGDFDIGQDRILVLDDQGRDAGKVVALSGSPNARDGARTTFQHFDEPHRMKLPRLLSAHSTMIENTYKRAAADPWTLYTSTAGDVNEASVAREMRRYAEAIDGGEVDDPRLFFFSRQAPDMALDTPEDVRAFLLEASGPDAAWSGDIDALVSRWFEPSTDRQYFRRVWGNQWVTGGSKAFDLDKWSNLARPSVEVEDGARITLGFDGGRWEHSVGLVATEIPSGHQFVVGNWVAAGDNEVPIGEITEVMTATFERFDVWRLYIDPPKWEEMIDLWEGRFGRKRVISWYVGRPKQFAAACRLFYRAIESGDLSHDGNPALANAIANSYRREENHRDDDGTPGWTIQPERQRSTGHIDLARAAVLSWEARGDAIAAGMLAPPKSKLAMGF